MASLGPRGSSVQGLVEFVKTLGASRIAAMGAVTIALIGFFVFLIMRVTTPQMTPLFTDLAYEDSAAIVKELDRQAVPYELRNDGNIVLVPKDRVARLRMSFAEGGLPKGAASATRFSTSRRCSAPRASCRTSTTCARSRASWPAPSARSIASRMPACIW